MSDSSAPIQGRPLQELTTPRPVMMPPPDLFDAEVVAFQDALRSSVPEVIRKRVRISRNLLVYGAFCYEFVTVPEAQPAMICDG